MTDLDQLDAALEFVDDGLQVSGVGTGAWTTVINAAEAHAGVLRLLQPRRCVCDDGRVWWDRECEKCDRGWRWPDPPDEWWPAEPRKGRLEYWEAYVVATAKLLRWGPYQDTDDG